MAEVWMRVVHRRRTVRGPAGVRNACAAFDVVSMNLVHQLRHARRAARPLQAALHRPWLATEAGRVHGHAAGVVAAIFQPLQALHEDGNNIAGRDGADDATHKSTPYLGCLDIKHIKKKYLLYFY
jgi:hypothetical protein